MRNHLHLTIVGYVDDCARIGRELWAWVRRPRLGAWLLA